MHKQLFLAIILATVLLLSAFHQKGEGASKVVSQAYHKKITLFSHAIDEYVAVAQKADVSAVELRERHLACRLAFKKVEYLLTIFEEKFVKQFINGAPLPLVTYNSKQVTILEPEGLQVLDELVMEDSLDTEEIIAKLAILEKSLAEIIEYEKQRNFSDLLIMDALRMQLIRIMSLGITGFDTPGSLNGLEESKISLASMKEDFSQYEEFCTTEAISHFQSAIRLFDESISYLDLHNDFETFNRMYFIRNLVNPLYEQLHHFHLTMDIETITDITNSQRSTNYKAKTPFEPDFLNPYYYSYLRAEQDNEKMAKLGSYLFYDPILSGNNSMSCSSCHDPRKGFTDGLKKSLSNDGIATVERNAPTLINSIFSKNHFYDLRADRLENQVLEVVKNPKEFHTDFDEIADKLKQSPEYQKMFESAFDYASWSKTKIDRYTLTTAITSYVNRIRAFNSPFDQYIRKETEEISPEVVDGFNLFMGKAACGTCHFAPIFNGLVPPDFHENETEVLGVPVDKEVTALDSDLGRFAGSPRNKNIPHYQHSFKTVTVRNVAVTEPYMHNGVYETLEEVMDFYNNGGGAGMGLTVPDQTLAADSLHLTDYEQSAIIRFLEALTDTSLQIHIPDSLPKFADDSYLNELNRSLPY